MFIKTRQKGCCYLLNRVIPVLSIIILFCMSPALADNSTSQTKQEKNPDEWVSRGSPINGLSPSLEWRQEWEKHTTRLTREKVKLMNSKEFLDFLTTHTLVYIGDSTLYGVEARIENWPEEKDIPYLLSQIDNIAPCASLDSGTFAIGPPPAYSTVGQQAVILLYAIKQEAFDINKSQDITDSEVIEWARKHVSK